MSHNGKDDFAALERKRQEIDQAIGLPVTWHNPPENKHCKIYVRQDSDFRNETLWPEQHQWLKEKLELFKRVFLPYVLTLGTPEGA
jgi:hypothetical protein